MRDPLQLGNTKGEMLWRNSRKIKIKFSWNEWKARSDKKCFCFYGYNETIFPPYLQLKNCYYCYCNRSVLLEMWNSMETSISILNGIVKFLQFHFWILPRRRFFFVFRVIASHGEWITNVYDLILSITCNFFFTFS